MNPFSQILDAIYYLRISPDFIKNHRLWEGYWKVGWVARSTVILGAIICVFFFIDVSRGFQELMSPLPQYEAASLGNVMDKVYFDGGIKYLILILLEMVIFYFTVRTLDVVKGTETNTTPKDFIDAQFRMIKVSIRNYIQEIILGTLISIVLGIFGMDWIKSMALIMIQFYFIGFAFMDNYYEQNDLPIRESAKYIRTHVYAAIVIGAIGYLLFMVPLLGALLGPFICAVAATLYLHHKSITDESVVDIESEGELAI